MHIISAYNGIISAFDKIDIFGINFITGILFPLINVIPLVYINGVFVFCVIAANSLSEISPFISILQSVNVLNILPTIFAYINAICKTGHIIVYKYNG